MAKIPLPTTQVINTVIPTLPKPLSAVTRLFNTGKPSAGGLLGALGATSPTKILSDSLNKIGNPSLRAAVKGGAREFLKDVGFLRDWIGVEAWPITSKYDKLNESAELNYRKTKWRDPMFNIDWEVFAPKVFFAAQFYIEDINIPFSNIQQAEGVFYQGTMKYFPKMVDVATFSVKLYEDNVGTTLQAIDDWKNLVRNPDGTYNLPAEYKGDFEISMRDSRRNLTLIVVLKGCFPLATESVELSSSGTERIIITQEFSVDNVVMEWKGGPSPSTAASGRKRITLLDKLKSNLNSLGGSLKSSFNSVSESVGSVVSSAKENVSNIGSSEAP